MTVLSYLLTHYRAAGFFGYGFSYKEVMQKDWRSNFMSVKDRMM